MNALARVATCCLQVGRLIASAPGEPRWARLRSQCGVKASFYEFEPSLTRGVARRSCSPARER